MKVVKFFLKEKRWKPKTSIQRKSPRPFLTPHLGGNPVRLTGPHLSFHWGGSPAHGGPLCAKHALHAAVSALPATRGAPAGPWAEGWSPEPATAPPWDPASTRPPLQASLWSQTPYIQNSVRGACCTVIIPSEEEPHLRGAPCSALGALLSDFPCHLVCSS